MINAESMKIVATYKKFEKGVNGKWHVSSIKCYTNGYQYAVVVRTYGSKHSFEKIFTNKNNANAFVKRYIEYGYRKDDK